jgi:hypothetical protein
MHLAGDVAKSHKSLLNCHHIQAFSPTERKPVEQPE